MKQLKTLAILLTLTVCAGLCVAQSGKAKAPTATVVFTEGRVSINGAAAETGQAVGSVFKIETGSGASCDIVFDGKNALRFGENTSASIDLTQVIKEVKLEHGSLAAVLRKLEKLANQDTFRVKTASAIAGVRGTSFFVWAAPKESYVCACNGKVRTIDAQGSNEQSLQAVHHSARLYSARETGTTVSQAEVAHHDDAMMESLAARIGEKIDWNKTDESDQ